MKREFSHISGDCRIECFYKLLQLEKINVEKAILFGLGEGLNLDIIEQQKKSIKYYSFFGRDPDAELRALKVLRIDFQSHINEEKGNVLNSLMRETIDNGKSIIANVDRYYLDYLPINKAHFGLHSIIISGYNDDKRIVHVIDSLVQEEQEIEYSKLNEAMQVELEHFSPKGIWITIGNIAKLNPSKESFIKAVVSNCKKLLDVSESVVNRIEKVLYNISVLDNEEIRRIFMNFQIDYICKLMLELEPTSSMYRKLYSEYLLFTADEINIPEMKDQAMKLKEIGGKWKNMSVICKDEKESDNKYHQFIYELKNIVAEENMVFQKILELININQNSDQIKHKQVVYYE